MDLQKHKEALMVGLPLKLAKDIAEGVMKMPNSIPITQTYYVTCKDCGLNLLYKLESDAMLIEWHNCAAHPPTEPLPPDDHSNHLKDQYGGCVQDSRGKCITDESQIQQMEIPLK